MKTDFVVAECNRKASFLIAVLPSPYNTSSPFVIFKNAH